MFMSESFILGTELHGSRVSLSESMRRQCFDQPAWHVTVFSRWEILQSWLEGVADEAGCDIEFEPTFDFACSPDASSVEPRSVCNRKSSFLKFVDPSCHVVEGSCQEGQGSGRARPGELGAPLEPTGQEAAVHQPGTIGSGERRDRHVIRSSTLRGTHPENPVLKKFNKKCIFNIAN